MYRGRTHRARRRQAQRASFTLIVTLLTLVTGMSGTAFAESATLAQCANGDADDGPPTACSWNNGNLNSNNSQYTEGDAVAFRSILGGLEVGDVYEFTIGWDTIQSTSIAYDYLVSWNHTESGDPAADTVHEGESSDSSVAIPADPRITTTEGITQAPGEVEAWGATLTSFGSYQYESGTATDPLPNSTMETTLSITFTADAPTAVIAWGGHLATTPEWAPRTTAAVAVNGSPYHMRLSALFNVTDDDDINLGNLDRSLNADAIEVEPAELAITKTASVTDVEPGGTFSYTITVDNNGGGEATNVVVTDTVNAAFNVTGLTPSQGSCDPPSNSVSCALGTIAPTGSATVTISVSVPSTPDSCQVVGNVATVTADDVDALDSSNVDVTITGCNPDLSLTKTNDTGGVAAPGETFTWTLTATNAADATATATDVQVTDTIPAGLTVDNIADGGADCTASSGNDVDCTIGSLAPGASVDIVVTVTVPDADSCASYLNNANLVDDAQMVDNDSDTVDVTGCAPDLSLEKTNDTGDEAQLGESFTWTLSVTNAADATATATDVQVTDTIPAGLTVDSIDDGGADCSASSGGDVDCTLDSLAPGDSVDIVVTVTVPEVDACGSYPNSADLVDDQQVVDTADDTVTVTVRQDVECLADVSLTKTASSSEVSLGGALTYTLVVTNAGDAPATATNVTVNDTVPMPLVVTDVSSADADCSASLGNNVSCDAGDLAPGESASVTVTVSVPGTGDVCGTVTNNAVANVDGEPVDSDTADVTIVGCVAAIDLVKTADLDEVDGDKTAIYDPFDDDDETVGYFYDITNTGTVPLTNLTLTDDILGDILTVADGISLEPGQTITVTAEHVLTGADATGGQVVNVAVATGVDPDQLPVSDEDTETVLVLALEGGVLPAGPPEQLPMTGGEVVPLFGISNLLIAFGAAVTRMVRGGARGGQRRR